MRRSLGVVKRPDLASLLVCSMRCLCARCIQMKRVCASRSEARTWNCHCSTVLTTTECGQFLTVAIRAAAGAFSDRWRLLGVPHVVQVSKLVAYSLPYSNTTSCAQYVGPQVCRLHRPCPARAHSLGATWTTMLLLQPLGWPAWRSIIKSAGYGLQGLGQPGSQPTAAASLALGSTWQ
jgi:hypothetical protein